MKRNETKTRVYLLWSVTSSNVRSSDLTRVSNIFLAAAVTLNELQTVIHLVVSNVRNGASSVTLINIKMLIFACWIIDIRLKIRKYGIADNTLIFPRQRFYANCRNLELFADMTYSIGGIPTYETWNVTRDILRPLRFPCRQQ